MVDDQKRLPARFFRTQRGRERALDEGLWEVRSDLPRNRIGRVLFCEVRGEMVLLHGFIKKTQTTPKKDLDIARARQKKVEQ